MKIINKKKFSSNDLKIAKLLIDDSQFSETIKLLRKFLKLPQELFIEEEENNSETSEKIINSYFNDKNNFELIKFASIILLSSYGLPNTWFRSMIFSLVMNQLEPPFANIKVNSSKNRPMNFGNFNVIKSRTDNVSIVILEKMSLTKLINELKKLDRNKSLTNSLKELPSFEDNINLSKIKNIDIKSKMLFLKNNNVSLSKISTMIEEEFKNDVSFDLNKSSISTYLNRYESTLNNLSDQNNVLVSLAKILGTKIDEKDPKRLSKSLDKLIALDKHSLLTVSEEKKSKILADIEKLSQIKIEIEKLENNTN